VREHRGAPGEGGEGEPWAKRMEVYGSMVMRERSGVFAYRVGSGRGFGEGGFRLSL